MSQPDFKGRRYAVYRLIPNYFDNDRGFVQRVSIETNGIREYIGQGGSTLDRSRLLWILRERIRRLYDLPFRPTDEQLNNFEFKFVEHQWVKHILEPDVFYCTNPDCRRMWTLRELRGRRGELSFYCPTRGCNGRLLQIPLLWVHSRCGRVDPILPGNCPKCIQQGRTERLRLQLNNNDLGKSFWWCGHCGFSTEPKRDNPNNRRFHKPCPTPTCTEENNGNDIWMRPVPAIKVYRPQSFSTFNRVGNWRELIAHWYGITPPTPNLDIFPEPIRRRMEIDPAFYEEILRTMPIPPSKELEEVLTRLGLVEEGNVDEHLRMELSEFAGLKHYGEGSILLSDIPDLEHDARNILERFKLTVRYIDGLPIIEATYGSLIGTSDKERAMLVLIDGPTGNQKWVFVREFRTEGLLFETPTEAISEWLEKNGHPVRNIRDILLSRSDMGAFALVKKLLHSISHLLIRKSEIFSGVSRETLAEFLFPHCLAFMIYNTQGSELGMLRTTFEAKMYRWLHSALRGASACVYDPICASKLTPCHGCMFIAERNCPEFNRDLDRDLIIRVRGDYVGYWS